VLKASCGRDPLHDPDPAGQAALPRMERMARRRQAEARRKFLGAGRTERRVALRPSVSDPWRRPRRVVARRVFRLATVT
jgi:hypothetical protein